ncbi:MAG: aldolase/citrate lyase family protein [Planctomycetota bacterium]
MNSPAIRRLRRRLAADEPVYGLWITLESPSIAEMGVALGLDWIVIDAEHGHLDWGDILGHVRAAVRSDTVVLVRVAELNGGLIKRALDIGADGVVVPWIESAEQLSQAVAYAHYPPSGMRGIGAERATGWGACFADHVAEADDHVLVVPLIETVQAGQNIEALCQVPGVEILFLGPADYASTAGYAGRWDPPGVAEQLLAVKDAICRRGKYCGVVAGSADDLIRRREAGFRVLGIGTDGGLMLRSLRESLGQVQRNTVLRPSFVPPTEPCAGQGPALPVPDRMEAVVDPASVAGVELAPGVTARPLVGAHNRARNLLTAVVGFVPGAALAYHTNPAGEAITLLSGCVEVEVEGRCYRLEPLDSLYVPARHAHQVANPSSTEAAECHVASACDRLVRTEVPNTFRGAPASQSDGGPERLFRRAEAKEYELAPGTKFYDCFNADFGSKGICGGWGFFSPQSRLPCHVHDYDESITIVQGSATCVVEGLRYALSGNATALVPCGRRHYFVNELQEPMAMFWVYAGDMPERVVLDDSQCVQPGTPSPPPRSQP